MSTEPNQSQIQELSLDTAQKTPLLNKAKVKALALACAQQRARKFTRVGNSFYVAVEAALRNAIRQRVANHPSIGVTLR
jgi:hypothetical protein